MIALSRVLRATSFTVIAIAVMTVLPVSAQTGTQTQSTTTPPPDTVAAPEPIVAIPASEVPKRAEETSAALREIRRDADQESGFLQIAEQFPETSLEIDERSADVDTLAIAAMSSSQLTEELQWWERARSQLTGWQSTLEKRSSELVVDRDEVREYEAVWELTRSSADDVEMPQAIRDRVTAILADIDTVGVAVSARLDTVLTLQDLISQKVVFIGENISRLKDTQSHVQRMIFAADSPPIWELIRAPSDSSQVRDTGQASWEATWAAAKNYVSRYESRFVDQLIVAILVLLLMLALAWGSRRWSVEGDEDLEVAVAILRRPLAVALFVALLFPGIFHPRAPSSIMQLVHILLLIPFIRLVPVVSRPEARRPIYLVAGLYALDQILRLSPYQDGLQRLLQILLAGLAIIGVVWLLRTAKRVSVSTGWVDAATFMLKVAICLLVLSLLGNVFGFVSLADLLLSATMTSSYYALLLVAAYRVTKAVIAGVLQTNAARKLRGIRLHTPVIKEKIYPVLRFGAVLLWIWATLRLFGIWDAGWASVTSFLGRDWIFGSMSLSISDVLVFFFAIWLSVQVSRFVVFVLSEEILPHFSLARGVPSAITRVSAMVIVAFGFVLAAAAAGIDLNQFTLLAGALGVGVGFGMQNIVNNFISGLILIFERPISAGDLIQFGTLWGTVQRIGLRSSTIRTFSGADVIVPNANLISTEVTNWSRSDQLRRVEVKVGVAYGTDPGTVIDVLEKTIQLHQDVFKEPAPYGVFHGFGDSSLDFEIRGWTKLDDWLRVTTETKVMVNNALKEAGIEIPFPQRDLHLRTIDPEAEDALAGRKRKPVAPRETSPKTPAEPGRPTRTHDLDIDGD